MATTRFARARRKGAILVLLALATSVWMAMLGTADASGGGGCGKPLTDSSGTSVAIAGNCFTPTVLHVQPGQVVSFTNEDDFQHTVSGANAVWGSYASVDPAARVAYAFKRVGVYPYVCLIHPGMTGAIVVGERGGRGAAAVTTDQAAAVATISSTPSPPRLRTVVPEASGLTIGERAVLEAFGVFVLLAAALGLQRRSLLRRVVRGGSVA